MYEEILPLQLPKKALASNCFQYPTGFFFYQTTPTKRFSVPLGLLSETNTNIHIA